MASRTPNDGLESALRESEERFRQIAESIHHVFWVTDLVPAERISYVSPSVLRIWGRPPEAFYASARLWLDCVHDEDRAKVIAAFEHWLAAPSERSYDAEFRIVRPDGEIRWVHDQGRLVMDASGRPVRVTGIAEDITARKRSELALRESEERFRQIADSINHVFWVEELEPTPRVSYVSPAFERIWGRPADEILANSALWMECIHPQDRPKVARAFENWLRTPDRLGFDEEYRVVRPDGEIRWIHDAGRICRNAEGRIYRVTGVAEDITSRKMAEGALDQKQRQFLQLIESLPQLVWTCGADGACDYLSPQWVAYTGVPERRQLGKGWAHQVHPDDRDRVVGAWNDSVAAGEPYDVEMRLRRYDGTHRWFKVRGVPLKDADGRTVRWFGTSTDIDEMKTATAALADREQRLRLAVEQLTGVWTTDRELRFNSLTGFSQLPEGMSLLGLPLQSVMGGLGDDHPAVAGHREALAGRSASYDFVSGPRHYRCSVAPLRDTSGEIIGVAGIATEFTDLQNLRQSLVEERDRLARLAEAAPSVLHTFRLGPDGTASFTGGQVRVAELYGLPVEAVSVNASGIMERIHPDDRERLLAAIGESKGKGGAWRVEYRILHPVRGERWIEGHSLPVADPDGGTSWHGCLTDITERKRAEEELRESRAKLETVFEHLTEGLVIASVDGNLLSWNRAAIALHGFGSPEDLRERFSDLRSIFALTTLAGEPVPFDHWPLSRILRGETLRSLELRLRHLTQGWEKVFSYGGALARDGSGNPVVAIVHMNDITPRVRVEEEIRRLNADLEQRVARRTEELEAANRELEAFSYSVSHDLRAPLRAVDGFSQAVLEDHADLLPEDGRRQLATIRDSAQRMGELIDDLLAFSRLSRQPLAKRRTDMGALVMEAYDGLALMHRDRNVDFRLGSLPECQGDPSLLRQVWTNLLSNALKYSRLRDPAIVEVGCCDADGLRLYYVRDNGTGFDMRYAHKLFRVFQRLHRAEDFEGTGVGLAIVQRIVARHGGAVRAHGEPGQGATFSFSIADTANP